MYSELEPLIRYFELETLRKSNWVGKEGAVGSISSDLEYFHTEHTKLQIYLDETITNEDLDEDQVITLILSEENPKEFQHFEQVLEDSKYMSETEVSQEDLMYEVY